jgi:sugar/nucleoside kinase (ribokinase family)
LSTSAEVDFVVVGHVTHDLIDNHWRPGGAALYASVTALRLGLRPAVLTRAASDPDLGDIPERIVVHRLSAEETTEFVNMYEGDKRTQRVTALAGPIGPADVPEGLVTAPIVLLGPVIGEVDPDVRKRFRGVVAVAAQGWLRRLDGDKVVFDEWRGARAIDGALAVFASTEDSSPDVMRGLVRDWQDRVPIIAITSGPLGGRLLVDGREGKIPVFRARQVDPTGAGDVFASAFLARYAETSDPYEATDFAAAAAACSVEGPGISAIPDREMILARRREGAVG